MFPSILNTMVLAALLISAVVFFVAFRFALREATSDTARTEDPEPIPRAGLHNPRLFSRNIWHRGLARRYLIRVVHLIQAGLVAFGVTSVFIMLLCMTGIFAAMLLSCI